MNLPTHQLKNVEINTFCYNQLREQYLQNVGSYTAGAARRGVKVGEGSARANIEKSAEALGKDVQTLTKDAKRKADRLRGKAEMSRELSEDVRDIQGVQKFARVTGKVGKSLGAYSKFADLMGAGGK